MKKIVQTTSYWWYVVLLGRTLLIFPSVVVIATKLDDCDKGEVWTDVALTLAPDIGVDVLLSMIVMTRGIFLHGGRVTVGGTHGVWVLPHLGSHLSSPYVCIYVIGSRYGFTAATDA